MSEVANTPIVALTANVLADQIEACRAAGMDDHLAKPYSRKQLISLITRWLPAHLAQLKAQYPQGVSEHLLPELLAQFTGPQTPQTHYTRPALRVVGGSRG